MIVWAQSIGYNKYIKRKRISEVMINVWIDDLTLCLKDNETGDFVQTEVVRIRKKVFYQNSINRTVSIQIGQNCCRSMKLMP